MNRRKSQRAERAAGCVWALGKTPEISQEGSSTFPDRAARPKSGPAAYWSRVRPTAAAAVGDVGHRAHQPVAGILHPARRRPGDEIRANAIGCWCQAREKRRVSNLQRQSRLVYCAPRR